MMLAANIVARNRFLIISILPVEAPGYFRMQRQPERTFSTNEVSRNFGRSLWPIDAGH
jgi:hypothetical protein